MIFGWSHQKNWLQKYRLIHRWLDSRILRIFTRILRVVYPCENSSNNHNFLLKTSKMQKNSKINPISGNFLGAKILFRGLLRVNWKIEFLKSLESYLLLWNLIFTVIWSDEMILNHVIWDVYFRSSLVKSRVLNLRTNSGTDFGTLWTFATMHKIKNKKIRSSHSLEIMWLN